MAVPHPHLLPGRDLVCSCHPSADVAVEIDVDRQIADEEDATQDDWRWEMPFGEFLVGQRAIDRHQLLRGLQMQDENPGTRLGECLAALGLIAYAEIEHHLGFWRSLRVAEA